MDSFLASRTREKQRQLIKLVNKQKIKVSVANPRLATHNNIGQKYPSWHPKSPKNAVVVPQAVAPTK